MKLHGKIDDFLIREQNRGKKPRKKTPKKTREINAKTKHKTRKKNRGTHYKRPGFGV